MKILSKERVDAKVIKKYDEAKTPYTRLMECADLDKCTKAGLKRRKSTLDLRALLVRTQELQKKLTAMTVPWR